MAAFLVDRPLVAGVDENWDEINTYQQVKHPDTDFSPIQMRTLHHLPEIFFDTLRPERPECPVIIPSTFSMVHDRLIAQDLYSYTPCGLPTGDFMPAEQAQIRRSGHARTGTLPRPELLQGNAIPYSIPVTVTSQEYKDAQVQLEVDHWFRTLPSAVQKYLLPLQSTYQRWYNENVCDLPQNYAHCKWCNTKTAVQSPRPIKRDSSNICKVSNTRREWKYSARAPSLKKSSTRTASGR